MSDPYRTPPAMPTECNHAALPEPTFDEEAAKSLPIAEIRLRWPRGCSPCPDCGATIIKYASFKHYLYGDW